MILLSVKHVFPMYYLIFPEIRYITRYVRKYY
jgi:hypothetical protein